jgi:hypothetical protein
MKSVPVDTCMVGARVIWSKAMETPNQFSTRALSLLNEAKVLSVQLGNDFAVVNKWMAPPS